MKIKELLKKEGIKESIIGIAIVIIVIVIVVVIATSTGVNSKKGLKKVYVATGGGKEDFLANEDVVKIMEDKYKLDVVYDSWSNGKTVQLPLV